MDPLSPSNINPSWGSSPPRSTPSTSASVSTPSRRKHASSSSTSHLIPPSQPASSPFREPKVFGAPTPGLVSPSLDGQGSGRGSSQSPKKGRQDGGGYLRVRLGALERNRKDLLIRFDANTNLPNYRAGTYRNMQRSYVEFQRFAEQLQMTSPQTIISALPLASTSAVTDEEDDRLVRIALQRWFTRICEDPVLLKDEELRSFIESDFGYSPIPPAAARRTMTTTSAVPHVLTAALSKVVRRGPLDEDDELQAARGALEKLEERWGSAAAAVGNLGKARRVMALANAEMGGKYVSLSTVESDPSLAQAERKVGRAWEQLSGMGGAQAASENVVMSDSLGYQALNARAAKDALSQRTQILEDSQNATKNAINKRRAVERMKGSSNINPAKVDDALHEMEDANTLEDQLSSRLTAISQNLHVSLRGHSRQAHEDVATALLENARLTIGYRKHHLRELEALKPELARVGTNAPPISTVSTTAPPTPSKSRNTGPAPAPAMSASRPYQSPPRSTAGPISNAPGPSRAPAMEGSQSMFLPPPVPQQQQQQQQQEQQTQQPRFDQRQPHQQQPMTAPSSGGYRDPLAQHQGQGGPGSMAQSMMLPAHQNGQPRQTQTVLTTQFWNTFTGLEDQGSVHPKESWTIHGLWPDLCDGSFRQYCDLSRQFDPRPSPNTTNGLPNGTVVPVWEGGDIITPTLEKWGKYDLLEHMNKYFKSRFEPDWDLWAHEYAKHATCFSTMDVGNDDTPNCYGPEYVNATERSIVDYFETTVLHDLQYPTYQWLEEAGITPSNSSGVQLQEMLDVLTNRSGAEPYLGCGGPDRTELYEVWYYSHSLGRPQEGIAIPVDTTRQSNCNATSPIWYYERSEGSEA